MTRSSCACLCWLLLAIIAQGQTGTIRLATLNTYWFLNGDEGKSEADRPRTTIEYSTKAGHLIGLLPAEAPLFIGFQELGGGDDLTALAHSASARYGRPYQTLFVRGRDSATGQNVGAILNTSMGWGVYGRPSRVSDLEREVSKHLVVRLTNAVTSMDIWGQWSKSNRCQCVSEPRYELSDAGGPAGSPFFHTMAVVLAID